MARAEVTYAPVHLYTSRRATQNPFFVVHCLIWFGEDDWKREEKDAPKNIANNARMYTIIIKKLKFIEYKIF